MSIYDVAFNRYVCKEIEFSLNIKPVKTYISAVVKHVEDISDLIEHVD